VIAPVTARVDPSKVKFASPFNPEPVPVIILLLASFAKDKVFAVQDKTPEPFVVNCVFALPSATGST
jgi:hypothetical protein